VTTTGVPYGTPEYGKAWRELHKERLAAERKLKYHTFGKTKVARRAKRINAYKTAKGCQLCGYNQNAVALDFDHLNPTEKKFTISHRLNHSTIKTLFTEIRKCRILCANCHRITTHEDRFVRNR
jgi:hypothetical protein